MNVINQKSQNCMTYQSLTGHAAIAWGARLALVNYIPGFAGSPAVDVIDTLSDWINKGEMVGKISTHENEADMLSAAAIAASNGQRVFAVTTDQYLMMAFNLINAASDWRVPMVLFNLAVPNQSNTSYMPGDDTALATRDSGFIQFCCASCQEILDMMLLAYRLSEDVAVRMPVLINLDHQSLYFSSEDVDIPNPTAARQFIGSSLQPLPASTIHPFEPQPVNNKSNQLGFHYSIHLASQQALAIYDDLADEFRDFFGRYYPSIETHACDDADFVIILSGANLHNADEAVTQLRAAGWRVGILRPRLLRPFPQHRLIQLLLGKKAVAVIDTQLSPGKGGVLHGEIVSTLYGQPKAPPVIASFLVNGSNHAISVQRFIEIAETLHEAVDTSTIPYPRLLPV